MIDIRHDGHEGLLTFLKAIYFRDYVNVVGIKFPAIIHVQFFLKAAPQRLVTECQPIVTVLSSQDVLAALSLSLLP